MYLSYEEYQNMGGTLDKATFDDLAFEAACKIDWWTFNRLKNETELPEAVKRCMYKLIKLIQQIQEATVLDGDASSGSTSAAGIASMSNDGVSISYNVMSASEAAESASKQIESCIRQYLGDVRNSLGQKVLYRGLYPGE